MVKKREYSRELAAIVAKFLDEDDWNYSFDEKFGSFDLKIRIHGKCKSVYITMIVGRDNILLLGESPLSVDESDEQRMARMAEFVCRANFGLMNGYFEFDMDDGELRYKCVIDCSENRVPSNSVIKENIITVAKMYERYADGIVNIIFGDDSPKSLIEKCENTAKSNALQAIASILGEEVSDDLLRQLESDQSKSKSSSEETEGEEDLMPEEETCQYNTDLFGSEEA